MLQSTTSTAVATTPAPDLSAYPAAEEILTRHGSIHLPADQQAGLADRLKQARKAAKLTQAALAKQIGLKTRDVQEMERGDISPCLNQVREIAAALKLSSTWLWFGRLAPEREPEQAMPVAEQVPQLVGPALVAEIERLHVIETGETSWEGDFDTSAGAMAQEAMWPLMDAALADPATVADPLLLARVTRCVIRSAGTEELSDRAGLLLAETVLSTPGADAEILSTSTALDELEQEGRRLAELDDQSARLDEIRAAQEPLIAVLSTTRSRTIEGTRAKARSLALWAPDLLTESDDAIEGMTSSILEDLIGGVSEATVDPDADLKAGCNELLTVINQMNVEAADTDITSDDPRHTQQRELVEQILAQAPTTLAGHQLRAQAILAWHGGMGANGEPASELHQDDFWLVIRDLIGQDTVKAMARRTAAICASYPDTVPA